MRRVTFFITSIIILSSHCIAQDVKTDGNKRINYRRTENSQPPTNYIQQTKGEIFPLGWNTGTLGKVTNGTGVWTELNPNVPRTDYLGVHFVNQDTG